MTPDQFAALVEVRFLKPDSARTIALRSILVDGNNVGDAARIAGIKYSAAWDALRTHKEWERNARTALGASDYF